MVVVADHLAHEKDGPENEKPGGKGYMNQDDYDLKFGYAPGSETKPFKVALQEKCSKTCSRRGLLEFIYRTVPILYWLPRYKWRRDFLNDVIGGLTVGIMHVPQGMAYANLAGLSPVYGLYSSFFSSTLYMFFGTCRQISVGCLAVASLLVGAALAKYQPELNGQPVNNTSASPNEITPIIAASALTLTIGLIQLAMGIFRLGFFVTYVSDPLVAGFTTGSAFQVMIPQLCKLIGTEVRENEDAFGLYFIIRDLIGSIPLTNYVTLMLSICSLIFLFTGKELVNPIVKRHSRVPIPLELILVIIGTVISQIANLNLAHGVQIVKFIPGGFPSPKLPRFDLIPELFADAIPLAIVCYAFVVSNGKLYAKKHKYTIDATQEFYALGITEIISSIFPVFPNGAALSRSQVCDGAGTKTQLYTVFSSTLLLLVILWLGPLLEPLPMCMLSCIVISSLKPLFMQFNQLPYLWKVSKYDFATFLVSCISTIVLNVAPGLLISLVFVMLTTTLRTQWTKHAMIHELPNPETGTNYYDNRSIRQPTVNQSRNYRIVRVEAPLCFSNIDLFHGLLLKAFKDLKLNLNENLEKKLPRAVIMDFSCVNYIDTMGVDFLKEAQAECKAEGVQLLFAHVSDFFPSIRDALKYLDGQRDQRKTNYDKLYLAIPVTTY